jgi:predicted kinase
MDEPTPKLKTLLQPHIVLLTGNMASGKSSVAQGLAERLMNSVHIRGDVFRRMIINGRAEMTSELSPEAERQLNLRYRIATDVAKTYHQAGFHVVLQDVIIGESLNFVLAQFQELPLTTVVLCPSPQAIAARDKARGKTAYGHVDEVFVFDRILREYTPRRGVWIDSSDLTLEETIERVMELLPPN